MLAVRQVARSRSAASGPRSSFYVYLDDRLRALVERDCCQHENASSAYALHHIQLPYYLANAAFRNSSHECEELSQALSAQYRRVSQLSAANAAQTREIALLRASSIERSVYLKLYKKMQVQTTCDAEQRAEIELLRSEIAHLRHDRTSEHLQAQLGQLKQKIGDLTAEAFKSKQLAAKQNFSLQQTVTRLETQYFALQYQTQRDLEVEKASFAREAAKLRQDLDAEQKKTTRLQESLSSAREACARTSKGLSALSELQAQINYLSYENMELHNALDDGGVERYALLTYLESAKAEIQRNRNLERQIRALASDLAQIREKLAAARRNAAEKPDFNLQSVQRNVELACAGFNKEETAMQRNTYSSAQLLVPTQNAQYMLDEQRETSAVLLEELQREKRANFELQLRASTLYRNIEAYESENLREQNNALGQKCRGLEDNLRRIAQQQTADQAQIQQLLRRLQRAQYAQPSQQIQMEK